MILIRFCCKLKKRFNLNKPSFFYENEFSKKTPNFILSGWQDSNLRPPAPKAGAITGLRYTPKTKKAESKGFEPLVQFPIRMFSKHVLSATQATLQNSIYKNKNFSLKAVANVRFRCNIYNISVYFFN